MKRSLASHRCFIIAMSKCDRMPIGGGGGGILAWHADKVRGGGRLFRSRVCVPGIRFGFEVFCREEGGGCLSFGLPEHLMSASKPPSTPEMYSQNPTGIVPQPPNTNTIY